MHFHTEAVPVGGLPGEGVHGLSCRERQSQAFPGSVNELAGGDIRGPSDAGGFDQHPVWHHVEEFGGPARQVPH